MHLKLFPVLVIFVFIMVACQPGTVTNTSITVVVETPALGETPTRGLSPAPSLVSPPLTATVAAPSLPEEAILIQEPGPGSQVDSLVRVVGVAGPTFEQNLVVRIFSADGRELNQTSTTIQADAGQRGEFEVEVPIEPDQESNLFIQVYSTSPRDGGITHLASTGVIFAPGGLEDITIQEPHPERIAIFQPQNNATISSGVAHVEGFALASFEQTLLGEVLDANGNVVGFEPITVQAPDLGQPGPFSVDIAYSVAEPGPGRIVVRDPSPAFDGDTHLNSVEVSLEP